MLLSLQGRFCQRGSEFCLAWGVLNSVPKGSAKKSICKISLQMLLYQNPVKSGVKT